MLYNRLVTDTHSYDYANYVFDRMEELDADMKAGVTRPKTEKLSEGHARITEAEFAAWKSGDWGYVSEHDGGGPRKSHAVPSDPVELKDYIVRTYEGVCVDLGCEDVSDPEFKDYVADQMSGQVNYLALQRALAML